MTTTIRERRAQLQEEALHAAQQRLRELRKVAWDVEPITEREYIERALAFAAWDGSTEDRLQQHELALLIGCRALDEHGRVLSLLPYSKLSGTFKRETWSSPKIAHKTLRRCLSAVMEAHEPDRRHMLELRGVGLKIGTDPQVDLIALWSGPGNTQDGQHWMLFPLHLPVATVRVVQLLADTSRPFGQQLAQCQECRGYFLRQRSRAGGRPRAYHDECWKKLRAKSRHRARRS